MPARARTGFTVLEVIIVLALIGVGSALSFPMGRRALDAWAVRTVRDAGISAIHRARVEARRRGGVTLEFRADSGRAELRAGDSLLWRWTDPADAGVELVLARDRQVDVLEFDARGLGRVTSRTLRFTRGEASRALVVSSRGRVTRR